MPPRGVAGALSWHRSEGVVDYPQAVAFMEQRVLEIHQQTASELIWFVEHSPLYTSGTSAKAEDLLLPDRFPVYAAGRGGQYTYHGPGQLVAYVMLDLKKHAGAAQPDLRAFVRLLEQWLIDSLAVLGIAGERREGRVGIWVKQAGGREAKIAALGIRVRKWVSYHGIALNINPNLDHFNGIIPCGIKEHGVTSLEDSGIRVTHGQVISVLQKELQRLLCLSK
jgi:lipoyl(octanoyl) transferase